MLDVINPATGEQVGSVPDSTEEDGARAVDLATANCRKWSGSPVHERISAIRRFLAKLDASREDLAQLVTRETGKTITEARTEVEDTHQVFQGFAERTVSSLFGLAADLSGQQDTVGDYMVTRREPLGLIVAILPFNFPIEMYAYKVAPALLTGNVVIVKPSEESPLSALRLTSWLHEAGVPEYALQCLTGRGESIGCALVSNPNVQAISMTGSTEAGVEIYQSGARHLARVFLELGGNDPLIVCRDADLELAVEMTVLGRTLCAGQCCSANKRILVDTGVATDFVELLLKRLDPVEPGDPLLESSMMGSLISESAAQRAITQVNHTVDQGAMIVLGGTADGAFVSPVVLTSVTPTMDIARDMEVFAPVYPIIVFDNEREMLGSANDTSFGLGASLFTADLQRAFRLATELACGMVVINGTSLYRPYVHAHGGYKRSGIGREGLESSLQEFTQPKSIILRNLVAYD